MPAELVDEATNAAMGVLGEVSLALYRAAINGPNPVRPAEAQAAVVARLVGELVDTIRTSIPSDTQTARG